MHRDNRYGAFLILLSAFFLLFLVTRAGTFWRDAPGTEEMTGGTPADRTVFPGLPLDLNTATRTELMALPGIGAKTADRILEARVRSGGFKDVSDLIDIERLGSSRVERLRGLLYVKAVVDEVPTVPHTPEAGTD